MNENKEFVNSEESEKAVNFMIETVNKYKKEVVIVSLGALSNVASCIKKDSFFSENLLHLYFMGQGNELKQKQSDLFDFVPSQDGVFEEGIPYFFYPNHNLSCDTLASHIVFESKKIKNKKIKTKKK